MARPRKTAAQAGENGARARQAYNGAIRAQLGDLQRARLIGATYDVSAERGAATVTVAHIVARSGVSRRTFYEQFTDREDCMLAAFEQALSVLSGRVVSAYEAQKGWREKIRAGLTAFLALLDEEPTAGRMLVVESLASGARVLSRRAELIGVLTAVVDDGRKAAKGATVAPLTAQGVVGGVLSVIQTRLTEERHASLIDLASPLMSMIVLPYLGAGAARRELERPVAKPARPKPGAALDADPFKELGLRLTYRTVRVLLAVAERPNGSNREIGETAGITDQGQISKLLARLTRAGLIENTGLHPGKGAPNSWALTEKGRRIAEAIRTHVSDEGVAS
jgi:AcrR family transcriptional regulator/DNA-binding MarR family transcriptional regulator